MSTEHRNGENQDHFRLYFDLKRNKNICRDSTILMYAFSTSFVNLLRTLKAVVRRVESDNSYGTKCGVVIFQSSIYLLNSISSHVIETKTYLLFDLLQTTTLFKKYFEEILKQAASITKKIYKNMLIIMIAGQRMLKTSKDD